MITPLPRTDDLPPALATPRRSKPQALGRPVAKSLAEALSIQRVEVRYERQGPLGGAIQRLGDNSSISLSGGDRSDFSAWWRVKCQPVVKRGQCRSPEGCPAQRLEGRSYCGKHHRLYGAAKPKPTGRMLVLSAAINRKRRPMAPRLDLLGG